jgi:RimJ/RimL family protein N-acetyltransferase
MYTICDAMGSQEIFVQDGSKRCPLTFGEATESKFDLCNELAAKAFSGPNTEQYERREQLLAQTPLMRDGGRRIWCLYKTEQPQEIVASCRIIRRQLLVRGPRGVTTERGFAIAGVCTDARYRGQGLASIIMRKTAEWMDVDGQAYASLLYSIVGPVRMLAHAVWP